MEQANTSSYLHISHRIRVRYGETDQMGVVYHPNYLIWFNDARDELLRSIGIDIAALERKGYRFPIVEVSCKYHHSAFFGDDIVVIAILRPESVARMQFTFKVYKGTGKRLLATGETVSVMTDHKGKLLMRLPLDLQKLIHNQRKAPADAVLA